MRRRFIADTWTDTTAALTGDQAVHLARVLRAEPGQIYDIVANGFLHRAEITRVAADEVVFTLHEELEANAALPLHLLLAIFKFDHFEWAVEKATELGVGSITPVLARRTEKHLAQAAAKRVERWRRIALEAAKQSRRTDIPAIGDPFPLKLALEQESAATRILLSETEQEVTLKSALGGSKAGEVALAIGPEGGWAPEEMALFTTHQWTHVTLGPRILRAETAAIAAIAISSTCLS
ncbi:16S rRNA (uracil1498-N3)-methyltransferase [Granulicella aggregans]|jgi:16S rRNA (uracil1498-N3)-methyltransferase|uniref:Ribosomal RNA small subunit methyltransferase E n=1 Tax=Granulicella aggregans TaxID=474949 RepID=A0A7W7ZFV6_9BACT|nr:RsmE family RNA methyltransferase [Granulicella aggregans]MBB5059046.1 16S rRNA (uracil1498-N3)-methyltransferase [Granulicella aggregans]